MKHIALGLTAILSASLALATPVDLARSVADAASQKGDVAAPVAEAFEKDLAELKTADEVYDCLFDNASAVGGALKYLPADAAKAAVAAVMKAAETCAKAIGALPEGKDLDANDTLGKCYATAIAALTNVLPPDGIRKGIMDYALSLVPAAFADQAKKAADDPADFLGRVKVFAGQAIAGEVADALRPATTTDADENEALLASKTLTSTTTTTTTTTTTSTTQVVIKLSDTLVDPVTLDPLVPPVTRKPPKPPVVVPPTRPSPTPVGLR